MKKYLWILLLLPSLCFSATGDLQTIGGKVDTAITSIAGKAGTAIASICGKNYTDGDAACTTPTGDVITESFGDSSSSCWTSGPDTCDNTWVIKTGTPAIDTSTVGAPDNTACTNSVHLDATSAAVTIYKDVGAGTVANNVEAVFNFTIYVDAATVSAWGIKAIASFNATTSQLDELTNREWMLSVTDDNNNTVPDHFKINAVVCTEVALTMDAWYNITITLDAAGAANGSTMAINGTSCSNFTRGAIASRYVWFGPSASGADIEVGNVNITTP